MQNIAFYQLLTNSSTIKRIIVNFQHGIKPRINILTKFVTNYLFLFY